MWVSDFNSPDRLTDRASRDGGVRLLTAAEGGPSAVLAEGRSAGTMRLRHRHEAGIFFLRRPVAGGARCRARLSPARVPCYSSLPCL